MQHLQSNTTLQGGKHRIERVSGHEHFDITYWLNMPVQIRKGHNYEIISH